MLENRSLAAKLGALVLLGASLPTLSGCSEATTVSNRVPAPLQPAATATALDLKQREPLIAEYAPLTTQLRDTSKQLGEFLAKHQQAVHFQNAASSYNFYNNHIHEAVNVVNSARASQKEVQKALGDQHFTNHEGALIATHAQLEKICGVIGDRRGLDNGKTFSTSDWSEMLEAKGHLDGVLYALTRGK